MSHSRTATRRRELAHRSNDGVQVHLLWSPSDDSLVVTVEDEAAEPFELTVGAHEALDAFNHPYAYAAFRGSLPSSDVAA